VEKEFKKLASAMVWAADIPEMRDCPE